MAKRYITRKTRRFHLKLHTKFINVFELRKNLDAKKDSSDFMNYGLIVDLSESGICVLTNILLKIDDFLDLSFTLPLKDNTCNIRLKGIVRWSRPKMPEEFNESRFNEYTYCSGIEFNKNESKTDIDKFLAYWKSLGMDKKGK